MFGLQEIRPHHSSRQVNAEIMRSGEKKNVRTPAACRWMLGSGWDWKDKCNTDAGQTGIRPFKQNHPRGCVWWWWWVEHVTCKSAQHQLTSLISLAGSPPLCWLWMSTRWTGPVYRSSAWQMERKALLPLRFLRVFSSDSLFFLISCLCIVALRSYSALAQSEVQSVLVEA